MHDLYMATVEKAQFLKDQGFNVVEVWECEIKRELTRDEEMKEYFDHYEAVRTPWNLATPFLVDEPTLPDLPSV